MTKEPHEAVIELLNTIKEEIRLLPEDFHPGEINHDDALRIIDRWIENTAEDHRIETRLKRHRIIEEIVEKEVGK